MKLDLNKYKVEDATHNLLCTHHFNNYSSVEYNMKCIILKDMPNNRVKIIVFGDRRTRLDYKDTAQKKRIRYVWKDRVKKISVNQRGKKNANE